MIFPLSRFDLIIEKYVIKISYLYLFLPIEACVCRCFDITTWLKFCDKIFVFQFENSKQIVYMSENYYQILGISKDASEDDIKKA